MKVFLGGTTNGSNWREKLISMLAIGYYNPVVENWQQEHRDEEIKQRKECDFVLYVITPSMLGLLSICELIDDSNKRPKSTVFFLMEREQIGDKKIKFTNEAAASLEVVKTIAINNGAKHCNSLEEIADYLNSKLKEQNNGS